MLRGRGGDVIFIKKYPCLSDFPTHVWEEIARADCPHDPKPYLDHGVQGHYLVLGGRRVCRILSGGSPHILPKYWTLGSGLCGHFPYSTEGHTISCKCRYLMAGCECAAESYRNPEWEIVEEAIKHLPGGSATNNISYWEHVRCCDIADDPDEIFTFRLRRLTVAELEALS
jgi:hypothetical protein